MKTFCFISVFCLFFTNLFGQSYLQIEKLPIETVQTTEKKDWLISPSNYKAIVCRSADNKSIILTNGLIKRVFKLSPNLATVALDNIYSGEKLLRSVRPEAIIKINNIEYEIGGLKGQPNHAYLTEEWIENMENNPSAMQFIGLEIGEPKERLKWKKVRHASPDAVWPPKGVYIRMDYKMPETLHKDLVNERSELKNLIVSVHYELYDGVPAYAKWISLKNNSNRTITINSFNSEILAAVEYLSRVEERGVYYPTPNIHVETEYAFGGFDLESIAPNSYRWEKDTLYTSQVMWATTTPCLLKVTPQRGPEQDIKPNETFESYKAFIMPFDSYERGRNSLAIRKLTRTISPWATENPLMMHMRYGDWESVKNAIDQCAEVGFEMIIMSFGSGFNIEDESDKNISNMKMYADYAKSKNIDIGGYSLLSSRSAEPASDNVVSPQGSSPTHGVMPALASPWGQNYFKTLYSFFEKTGQTVFEHDGSYPGDWDIMPRPPLQKGLDDSQWVQWRIISEFYKWCKGEGIYLNIPDYYFHVGANKIGMGYREDNWSLPRAEQLIHTRQNIYDGTWEKIPSMGWMHVPLMQYHGGGAAATIEPLSEHLDHYENIMVANLGAGVQAVYRGKRLYDTDKTKEMVKRVVTWYKKYRDILESDIIHLRRANGITWDGYLHVNPKLKEKGFLMLFNPSNKPIKEKILVPIYYTGITGNAEVENMNGKKTKYQINSDKIELDINILPNSYSYYIISN